MLVELDKFEVSRHFLYECMEVVVKNMAFWCILTTLRTDFDVIRVCWYSTFWQNLSFVNWSDMGFLSIFWVTHERTILKFGMLMYPDHLQYWIDFGQGLLMFLILKTFWKFEITGIFMENAFAGREVPLV